jgi:hypothetical protein
MPLSALAQPALPRAIKKAPWGAFFDLGQPPFSTATALARAFNQ